MAVPTLITDLSTTAASNSPSGSENVFPNLDDYLRAQAAFLASVRDNSGNGWVSPYLATAGGTMTGTVAGLSASSLNGGPLAGLRNYIINGNMGIAQRGTAAVTASGGYGPADRWFTEVGGDTFSTTQGSFVSGDTLYDTGGAQYFTTIAVTSVAGAGNYAYFVQRIEDVRLLAGQTVTVSFWAKAAAGTPSIGISIDQNFGVTGSPSATVTGTGQAQALTTIWTKYTKTFSLPSINGKTIGTSANFSFTGLNFWLDAGSSNNTRSGSIGQASKTVSIAQVQLEIGSVATPFEFRPIGMELALCQRYLPVMYGGSGVVSAIGQCISATSAIYVWPFPVIPRVTPTGITLGSAVGSFSTGNAAGSNVFLTSLVYSATSLSAGVIASGVASGLTAGNASYLFVPTNIQFTGCEL